MKLIESFLGFKTKKSLILEQRNSILKLLLILNIPSLLLLLLLNKRVPSPYMDEEFHYGQFLRFYQGDYHTWDPKITTPPGLYYIQRAFSFAVGDSLAGLRALTCLLFGSLFAVFSMKIYDLQDNNRNNLMRSLNLALTPTLFFFNFLDYTDTVSLALMTMSFYYCLVGSVWRMGISSLLSVFVRQNNIIWCGYLLLYRITVDHSSAINSIQGNFIKCLLGFARVMLSNVGSIVKKNIAQVLIFPLFLWYLHRYNNGRLLFGDHEHHVPVFHPTQMLYLTLFLFVNLPITISDFMHCLRETFNRIYYSRHAFATYLFLLSASLVIVDKCSYVHPFILADNRHYIFYIYRYFRWAKYPLCLLYPFLIIFLGRLVVTSKEKLIRFIIWGAVSMLYLMLSELVEFRYFTIPFVMLAFEVKNKNMSLDIEKIHGLAEIRQGRSVSLGNRMLMATLWKMLANAAIMYVFLFRAFGEDGQSRFIW